MLCLGAEFWMELEDDVSVNGLLGKLVERYGEHVKEHLFDPASGQLQGRTMVLKNGRNIRSLKGMETSLEDGDVISIFLPVGGG